MEARDKEIPRVQGAGVLYQVVSGYRDGDWKGSVVTKIGYGWQIGWLFQDVWQFLFVRESVVGMWFAAVALIGAYVSFLLALQRLNGTTRELRARGYATMPAGAYVCYKLPTAINAAWLSVATCLGLLIVPVAHGVEQRHLVAPAAILTVAATAVGVWRLAWHRDAAYGFTLIWALSAVASNESGNVPTAVKVVGIICLVVLALFVVSALVRTRRELSSASASSGGGADGSSSLLHNTYGSTGMYGAYGQYGSRTALSDASDAPAPAGYGHEEHAHAFTFPVLGHPNGGSSGSVPAAAPGIETHGAEGRKAPAVLLLETDGGGVAEPGTWSQAPASGALGGSGAGAAALPTQPRAIAAGPQGSPRGAGGPAVVVGSYPGKKVRFSDEPLEG
ncbi:hypothetical protein GPECTOR_25g450 [Gonium pectorale]|uniref:Uncharacterized protein n=1 Tax=Gonium pectorale TaxID=33097 RepID=A0A150GGV9_GONPE|nr:hypothetical protein GPECTOR_25g450 [Gonium pectorale]|eukprot:KXZ48865.1 hypothetical protein GPECTOR_25g450 [Gonium pectorale]